MNDINETTRFSMHARVVYTIIDDEAVVMGALDDTLYAVNNVGTEILTLFETQSMSVQSLADYLFAQYEVNKSQCVIDAASFIKSLLAGNLIVQMD